MVDINRLLKKKGWTGDEVGKALILSLIDAFKQNMAGVPAPKELFTPAQLKTMVMSLKDRQQGIRYNRYLGLQSWLMQYQAVANAHFQRLQGDITSLLSLYSTARAAEETSKYIENLPVIMTQKQHDEIRAKRIEEQLAEKGGYSAFQMLHLALTHYMVMLRLEPDEPNPLKAIKKKYQTAPVVTERILSRYNEVEGNGYYTLPDGRRSDQMTSEEWQEALTTPAMREMMSWEPDKDSPPEMLLGRATNRARIIFAGGAEEEADKAQEEAEERKGWVIRPEWHYYEKPPADLHKWDILERGGLADFYPALNDGKGAAEQAKAFKKEFPELAEALMLEVEEHYFKGFKDIPVEKWAKTIYSRRDLYAANYWGIRALIEQDESIFKGNQRAIQNGIAILRASDYTGKSPRIDENGYYIEPEKRRNISATIGLERFTPENPEYMEEVRILEETRANIAESIYWIKGFNKAIEMTAESIGLPDFTIFKVNIGHSEARLKALNSLFAMFYTDINATEETKLQVLKDYFHPFSEEEVVIPDSVIEKARALLSDNLKAFETQDGAFIRLLTEREV